MAREKELRKTSPTSPSSRYLCEDVKTSDFPWLAFSVKINHWQSPSTWTLASFSSQSQTERSGTASEKLTLSPSQYSSDQRVMLQAPMAAVLFSGEMTEAMSSPSIGVAIPVSSPDPLEV